MSIYILFTSLLWIFFAQLTNAASFSEEEIDLGVAVGISADGRRLTSDEREAALSQTRKEKRKIVTPDLFSKAYQIRKYWGVSGESTTALIAEHSGICPGLFQLAPGQFTDVNNQYEKAKHLNTAAATEAVPNPVNFFHGTVTTHTTHQIAPNSTLCAVHKYSSKDFTVQMIPEQLKKEANVINASHMPHTLLFENDRYLPELIYSNPDNPKLLILCAGNSGNDGAQAFYAEVWKLRLMGCKDVWPHSILCIAIDPDNCVEPYSETPGFLKEIQEKSICALGRTWSFSSMEKLESQTRFTYEDLQQYKGTSISTSIVTGAVLLLESYLKKNGLPFDSTLAQEILFNSARRTFIATNDDLGFKMTLLHYDPEDEKYNLGLS